MIYAHGTTVKHPHLRPWAENCGVLFNEPTTQATCCDVGYLLRSEYKAVITANNAIFKAIGKSARSIINTRAKG